MKTFKDRVAVVTGAAGGIGNALVEQFVSVGMKVVLAGINKERLDRVVDGLRKEGGDVVGIETDVSRADQVAALADYNKAITRYLQVSGQLLEAEGVRFQGTFEDESQSLLLINAQ